MSNTLTPASAPRAKASHPRLGFLCAAVVLLSATACSAQAPDSVSSKAIVDAQAPAAASGPAAVVEPAAAPEPAAASEPAAALAANADSYGSAYGIRPDFEACITHQAPGMSTAGHRQECADQELEFQDARLNRVYQAAMAKLKGGSNTLTTEASQLRDAQRKWLAQRDPLCAEAAAAAGSNMGPAEQSRCYMDQTAKRADELERTY